MLKKAVNLSIENKKKKANMLHIKKKKRLMGIFLEYNFLTFHFKPSFLKITLKLKRKRQKDSEGLNKAIKAFQFSQNSLGCSKINCCSFCWKKLPKATCSPSTMLFYSLCLSSQKALYFSSPVHPAAPEWWQRANNNPGRNGKAKIGSQALMGV